MNFEVQTHEVTQEQTLEQRKAIIDRLTTVLQSESACTALMLEGADTHGSVDEYSDIDVRLVFAGDRDHVLEAVEEVLTQFGPIDYRYERQESRGVRVLFHIAGTSKFSLIDVYLQPFNLTEKIAAKNKRVLFDKVGVVESVLTSQESQDTNEARLEKIKANKALRDLYVEREIRRGNFLEALNQYQNLILGSLVEALRIKYCPQYKDLQLKHITRDLPHEIVAQLEELYHVGSIQEIIEKKAKADELLQSI